MNKIQKTLHFEMKRFHEDDENDNIGVIEGHISTFGNVDRDGDVIGRNAFDRTLVDLKASNKIFLPMLWQHRLDIPIGGFPIKDMHIDDKGLFVVGEVNKATEKGRDAFALLKQGVITDFSIGFFVKERKTENGVQILEEVELLEASLVTIPANPMANVTTVKTVVPFQNLPIARIDGEPNTSLSWDSSAAVMRIRMLTGSDDEPTRQFRNAFLWFDGDDAESFGAYKLPIADVINGRMTVVPRAIFAAAAALAGARGGVDIPDDQRPGVIANLNRYYDKMGLESPFEKGFGIFEIKAASPSNLRKMLQNGTKFTKAAADMLSGLEAGRRKGAASNGQDSSGMKQLEQALKNYEKDLSHA